MNRDDYVHSIIVSFGKILQKLSVAGPGIEPDLRDYEPHVQPYTIPREVPIIAIFWGKYSPEQSITFYTGALGGVPMSTTPTYLRVYL